jgi:hypothetical protein
MTRAYLLHAEALDYLFSVPRWFTSEFWWIYFSGVVHALVHLSLLLSPLALSCLSGRHKRSLLWSSALVALVTGFYVWRSGEAPILLDRNAILSHLGLGFSKPLIPGNMSWERPRWILWSVTAFSLISAIGIIDALRGGVRSLSAWTNLPSSVVVINGILQLLAVEALWLYKDRYYLPLLPGLIALLVIGARRARVVTVVAVGGVSLCAALSISGTIDNLRFGENVSKAREWLLGRGIAPWRIDAGYALNGWWLYAHPENLPPGARPESDVVFVTAQAALPYAIASSPLPSYKVLAVFESPSIWTVSNDVYVMQKTEIVPSLSATVKSASVGAEVGTARIAWSTGDGSVGQVYLSESSMEETIVAQGVAGSRDVSGLRTDETYEFRLYSGTERRMLLATVKVEPRPSKDLTEFDHP